ncbi:hypothetical protein HS088_TW15G00200 [Tripterygium wilfordii]|uniref:Uncharacterized protein n=1 Tax=Tripterygium wilfordii TaxID=458696 RepID=A0A7J7CKY6_TRIWF|nr:methyl-CpG-binding protein 2 [Tripterygium wilfordii]KAF5734708.1 hypothetical protein HS088_TW15G00200 [Tripterygium wilfordii]
MEQPNNALPVPEKSKLRYPLRSATKSKEEKPPVAVADPSNFSSASKRGRPASTVSKSMGVLDVSAKEKSAKPPRRLSIPTKSTATPGTKATAGNVTPISEIRTRRSGNGQRRSETPVSDVSNPTSRRRFSVLSSASYWLSQIKLSEAAAKHSISLGFFKLALEAGCEPIQRMRDELKSYAQRHNLGEPLKELLESYNIPDTPEQEQVSKTCSQVPEEEVTRSSEDEVHSSSSTVGTRKLKPRSLNTDAAQVPSVMVSANKDNARRTTSAARDRRTLSKNTANSKSNTEAGAQRSKKSKKQEPAKEKEKAKKQGKKSTTEEGPVSPSTVAEPLEEENKENMDDPTTVGLTQIEVN